MTAQLLTVALECTSARQCALPRSGFVHGPKGVDCRPDIYVRFAQYLAQKQIGAFRPVAAGSLSHLERTAGQSRPCNRSAF